MPTIVIGGHTRNIGKTSVVARWIAISGSCVILGGQSGVYPGKEVFGPTPSF